MSEESGSEDSFVCNSEEEEPSVGSLPSEEEEEADYSEEDSSEGEEDEAAVDLKDDADADEESDGEERRPRPQSSSVRKLGRADADGTEPTRTRRNAAKPNTTIVDALSSSSDTEIDELLHNPLKHKPRPKRLPGSKNYNEEKKEEDPAATSSPYFVRRPKNGVSNKRNNAVFDSDSDSDSQKI